LEDYVVPQIKDDSTVFQVYGPFHKYAKTVHGSPNEEFPGLDWKRRLNTMVVLICRLGLA
jgi:hypothetical protein